VNVGAELQDARWFSAPELRAQIAAGDLQISPRLSISRWLIDDWLSRH
jgi:NAD+ diphosphatase